MNIAESSGNTDEKFAGSIHLVRHGEPDLPWRGWLSRSGFNTWWTEYDQVELVPTNTPPKELVDLAAQASLILASPIRRAHATAQAIVGSREIRIDKIYEEAPLPAPFILPFLHISPLFWGILARFTWWLGYAGGGESRYETEQRVREAVDGLIEMAADERGDIMLCGHGWFIHMASREIQRRGWIKIKGGGRMFWDHKSFASPV